MQNEMHSLMHASDFGGGQSEANAYSLAAGSLQQLHQDNVRLRIIVAQLLLKNQSLRWQLGGRQSRHLMLALVAKNEIDGHDGHDG